MSTAWLLARLTLCLCTLLLLFSFAFEAEPSSPRPQRLASQKGSTEDPAIKDAVGKRRDFDFEAEHRSGSTSERCPERKRRKVAAGNHHKKKIRIAIVTLNDPGGHGVHRRSSTWMWPYTIANRRLYCAKHGYDLHVEGRSSVDPSTPPSWSKIKLIKKYLPFYDYVLWVDVDVLFTNFNKTIEDIITENPYDEVIASSDLNGLNAGVMLFQSTAWTSNFLDEVWHFNGDRRHVWQEQYAISELLRFSKERSLHFKFIHQRKINAFPYTMDQSGRWQVGDLLVHLVNCDSRPSTCWDEFRFYFNAQSTLNQIVYTDDQIASQPPQLHFIADLAPSVR